VKIPNGQIGDRRDEQGKHRIICSIEVRQTWRAELVLEETGVCEEDDADNGIRYTCVWEDTGRLLEEVGGVALLFSG
jgi:hypothetical protein